MTFSLTLSVGDLLAAGAVLVAAGIVIGQIRALTKSFEAHVASNDRDFKELRDRVGIVETAQAYLAGLGEGGGLGGPESG